MDPPCKITRLNCDDPAHMEEVSRLADKADLQIGSFEAIFPWLSRCEYASRHYVAKKDDDTICGWMSVNVRNEGGQKYFYLSEISVIRVKDASYKGVGRRLHDTLVEEGKKEGIDFIYLYPLNEVVTQTYTNWGYKKIGDLKHMFYIIKAEPTVKVLNIIKPQDVVRRHVARAYNAAHNILKDKELTKLVLQRRRDLIAELEKPENKDHLDVLKNTLDITETNGYYEEENQQDPEYLKEELKQAILAVPIPVRAGRRTRRHKKRRQTRRKRNHRV